MKIGELRNVGKETCSMARTCLFRKEVKNSKKNQKQH